MQGKTVAILENRLGSQLAELLAKRGARTLHAPALSEVPDVDPSFVQQLLQDLEAHPPQAAIFQTGVGTHALFRTTDALGLTAAFSTLLTKSTVVVRGPKPTAALRSRGVRIDLAASEPFTTREVLQALAGVQLAGARVIVQRYGAANVELDETLGQRGAEVIEIPTYRWTLPQETGPLVSLIDALDAGEVDAVVFTNAAQVHNLFAMADRAQGRESLKAALNRAVVGSIGPVCSDALRKHDVRIGLEAHPPKLGPLVSALDQALSDR